MLDTMRGGEYGPPDELTEPAGLTRRQFLMLAGGVAAAGLAELTACSSPDDPEIDSNGEELLEQVGNSLIELHEEAEGGWRFRSAIQAPHYQTDRDGGASSVGMGFLILADHYPDNPKWVQAAEHTAGWLLAVAQKDPEGRMFWPDYADDGETSTTVFTSFDDGSIGIGDYFWQLYERTQKEQYREAALSSLQWTFAQAENIGSVDEPMYRWPWGAGDEKPTYYMGMGQGAAGLVHTFATYYERLQEASPELAGQCRQYIDGSLRYIDQTRTELARNDGDARALPETGLIGEDGDTCMNSGYLHGAAGAAFMYLKLYQVFGEEKYIAEAIGPLNWLEDAEYGPVARFGDDKRAWQLALDPQGGDNSVMATGFEEGSAGIGWVYLQAYNVTGTTYCLDVAKQAANWLAEVAVYEDSGAAWHEVESPAKPVIHANLNNGVAGIGMFLKELADVSGDAQYQALAEQALEWLKRTAVHENGSVYWKDNDGEDDYARDPSWHWGLAGIAAFTSRMAGGKVSIPGQQPALPRK